MCWKTTLHLKMMVQKEVCLASSGNFFYRCPHFLVLVGDNELMLSRAYDCNIALA